MGEITLYGAQRSHKYPRMMVHLLMGSLLLPLSIAYAGDTMFLPVYWCAVDGTPAVISPGAAPTNPYTGDLESTTDDVLWRRHERATDKIWSDGAGITFRSGFTADVVAQANFPVIPDPCPPNGSRICQGDTDNETVGRFCEEEPSICGANDCVLTDPLGCPGLPGDLQDPAQEGTETMLALAQCQQEWSEILSMSGGLPGIVAVNLGRYVDSTGAPTSRISQADLQIMGGEGEADVCENQPEGGALANILIIDNQFSRFSEAEKLDPQIIGDPLSDTILARELGRVLSLGFGNGLDDNEPPDGLFDRCDPTELPNAPPENVMKLAINDSQVITVLQEDQVRSVAPLYAGNQTDPPGTLIPGPTHGDQRTDPPLDVSDRSIDIVWVAVLDREPSDTTTFAHGLFGLIPSELDYDIGFKSERQYVVFADLDGDAATGGSPSSLGFITNFQGAELVTRVVVSVDSTIVEEFVEILESIDGSRSVSPTVWLFQEDGFVECMAAVDPTCAEIRAGINTSFVDGLSAEEGESTKPQSNIVWIKLPNTIRGPMNDRVRIQALAEQLDPQGPFFQRVSVQVERDRLPDKPLEGAEAFFPVPPVFPVCLVTPDPVQAGTIAKVEASGLTAEEMAKVFVGDRLMAQGSIDTSGNVRLRVLVPSETAGGNRLVTVGVAGTALTADCVVNVLATAGPSFPATCDPTVPGAIIGTPESDILIGTQDDDVILGLGGNDVVIGLSGDDCIDGGPGDDILLAGHGTDRIIGGSGSDRIIGGAGSDSITGGTEHDLINSGSGDDRVSGGFGNDRILAGSGDDEVDGGMGKDKVIGGSGSDTCVNGEFLIGCEIGKPAHKKRFKNDRAKQGVLSKIKTPDLDFRNTPEQ